MEKILEINSLDELDMVAAEVGMQVFLVTDCLINRKDRDISDFRHGDMNALWKFIKEITE